MSRFTLTERLDECLVLETKFGKLLCWKVRDDAEYKEFSIDLIANDGKEYQVACIGTNEQGDDPCFGDDRIHVHVWDGQRPDDIESFYMDPCGDGFYYGPEEE